MIVALDYDDTYTRDPAAWGMVARVLRMAGHTVVGVTMRYREEITGMDPKFIDAVQYLYPTGRKAKMKFMDEAGIRVDVWIDDRPEFILRDALI